MFNPNSIYISADTVDLGISLTLNCHQPQRCKVRTTDYLEIAW
jgi:hypothetical protein